MLKKKAQRERTAFLHSILETDFQTNGGGPGRRATEDWETSGLRERRRLSLWRCRQRRERKNFGRRCQCGGRQCVCGELMDGVKATRFAVAAIRGWRRFVLLGCLR